MGDQFSRGLFDLDFALHDGTGLPTTTEIKAPFPQRLAATYQSDSASISGKDQQLETLEFNERYEIEIQHAGVPLAFFAALLGVTLGTAGSGATLVTTLTKNVSSNQRSPGRLRAQQKDKTGGDLTWSFPKVNASGEPSITMENGTYNEPTIALTAVPATQAVTGIAVGDLYSLQLSATFAALS